MMEPDRRPRPFLSIALAFLVAIGAVVLAVVVLDDDDDSDVQTAGTTTTSTSTTSSTTTTAAPTTTTTAATQPAGIDATTPLNPRGVGPIEAGMTVAQAAAASGLSLTPDDSLEAFGGFCYYVDLEGQPDLAIRAHSPGDQPVDDPGEGVISAITIYALDPDGPSTRLTTAGVGLGASEAQVRAAHGDSIEERPHDYVPEGAYLYVHPADAPGFGIRYVLDENRVVTSIDVGDAGGITAAEGCA